ncbi:TonB-dependent receptor [Tamlana sp. 2_MG-2023]|uniref:TonB-dependent receptor n=1 Tax=unclassified Tamlana TaxID=2614803 RepID=UPI0026E3389A|nr:MULTISPECIES: TonB-dependent receptor [unclassified Tamlana]MDO6758812.1 TonB-dependent receptor [Tamlana sp. 2_MG-2023]MDO6789511.1 TonB-dependent receptor [Tamlana sp. 1_MG-2023]
MKLLLNTLLLLAITSIYAQNNIQGVVTDTNTNEKLELVNIYISELEKGTTTDVQGHFTLEDLPSGNYNVVFSMIGYEKQSVKVKLPQNNGLEISLKASAIEMESVIISTPFHKLQRDNVMKVEHETVENLKANGALTLAEGISNIAGVESVTTGLGIGKPVIRGLSSNRVLVFTQGVRLENQQFGGEHGLGINDAGIESVEVIKGPASLLYGSDALGGVLYLNPEKFAAQDSVEGDVGANYFSNTQGYNTNVGYKSSANNFKFLVRGSVAEHSDYETANYRATNTRFKEKDFKAGIGYQVNTFKTEFRYNVNSAVLGIPEGIGEQSTNKTPLLPYQDITNHVFSSKSTVFFENSKLDINLGYIYNDRKEFEDEHDHDDHNHDHDDHDHDHDDHDDDDEHEHEEAALHMKLKTANYDIKYHLPTLGKFETIVGVQGMNQLNTNYGEEVLIPDATTNDFGVLGVSHIHFKKADVQLGLRFDHRNINTLDGLNRNFNSINGALGVKTNLTDNITARVNVATGFRAPNLSELTSDGVHHGTNRYEIGNADLDSEQNIQTDIALEYKSEHFELFANGFYNLVNNYIFLSPTGTEIDHTAVYEYAQDDAALYGGEFGLHIHPHPLDWLHFESSFEMVTGKQRNDDYLPLIPANSLTNVIRAEFEKPWFQKGYTFIKLRTTFDQNNVSQFETPTLGYNLLSAGIGGSFSLFSKELSVVISGNNLTNKTYFDHLSRLKSEGIYNMGRNITVGFTYHL